MRRQTSLYLAFLAVLVAPFAQATPAGRVVAWGANGSGQTNVPADLTNVIALAGGESHAAALRVGGTVRVWGDNSVGQTNVPVGLTGATSIAAGWHHMLAIRSNGTVVAWGNGANGQTNVPAGLSTVIAVAGGWRHSVALRSNGTVVAWGNNGNGQTNVPAGLSNVIALAAGRSHNLALRSNGTVVAWGQNTSGQTNVPGSLTNVVGIEAGEDFSLALLSNGSVVVWGNSASGQTNLPSGATNGAEMSGGNDHAILRRADRTLVGWGDNASGQTNVPTFASNVVAISAGGAFNLAVLVTPVTLAVASQYGTPSPDVGSHVYESDQSVTCSVLPVVITNANIRYVGTGWSGTGDMPAVGTSNEVTFVMTQNSTLTWQWETNFWLGITSDAPNAVSGPSGWHTPGTTVVVTAISLQGYVFLGWGGDTNGAVMDGQSLTVTMDSARMISAIYQPVSVFDLPPTNYVFAGGIFSNPPAQALVISNAGATNLFFAIESSVFWLSTSVNTGSVPASGAQSIDIRVDARGLEPNREYRGHLIVTDPLASNSPVRVDVSLSLTNGYAPSLLVGWGENTSGQASAPSALTNVAVRAMSAGELHSVARAADGRVYAWGDNSYDQLEIPAPSLFADSLSAGWYHSVAIQSDSTLVAWGRDDYGQSTVPVGLSNVVGVAAGGYHSLALCANGQVVAWGRDDYGQTNVPVDLSNVVGLRPVVFIPLP